jgi:hypothetical protein
MSKYCNKFFLQIAALAKKSLSLLNKILTFIKNSTKRQVKKHVKHQET